jgi:ribosomal protein L23
LNRPGKVKKSGRGIKGRQEGYRKAIVTIKEGQKIDLN